MKLAKWQGLGNDYLVVEEDALPGPLAGEAIEVLCDRHFGVGSDGILLRCQSTGAVPGAVSRMRVFNPDGSEPEMCGNGIRIFARYLARQGVTKASEFMVETLAGPIKPQLLADGRVRVDMGAARFRSPNVLLTGTGDVVRASLMAGGTSYQFTFVDVGNPHCVIQVDDPARFDVRGIGAIIERHSLFPNRTNVEFVRVEPDGSVAMRVWERGVGETQACGTGATAVGAAVVRLGLTSSPVVIHLPGGDLAIEVETESVDGPPPAAGDNVAGGCRVFMTGPAEEICSCELSSDLLSRLRWPVQSDG